MRNLSTAVVGMVVTTAMLVAGCSKGGTVAAPDDGGTPDTAAAQVPKVSNGPGNGFTLDDCGGFTDAEIIGAVGNPLLKRDVDSLLGCRWTTGPGTTDTSISLYWYRGSSTEKEASVARNFGHHVEAVTTKSYPGFEVSNIGLCELSAGSGPDFLHWSLQSGSAIADPCGTVETLMDMLLDRVGKE